MGPTTILLVAHLMTLLMLALGRRLPSHYNSNVNITARNLYLTGKAVAAWEPCSDVYPWELSSLEEGDMLRRRTSATASRMVYTEEKMKWEDRTLPFIIETADFKDEEIELIRDVARELNAVDCVTLRETTSNDTDYVRITGKKEGCFAEHWGRKGGEQVINLQPKACLQRGTVHHMLFHVLGFCHLHNNPIRDDYITVLFENVIDDKKGYLIKYNNDSRITDFMFRYDYESVMHASRRAYSKNNLDTIMTNDPTVTIGKRVKPSYIDLQKLRKLYDCDYEPSLELP